MADNTSKKDISELRSLLRHIEARTKSAPVRAREPVDLQTAVPGSVRETERGTLYLIEEDARRFLDEDDEFSSVTDLFFKRGQVNRTLLESAGQPLSSLCDLPPDKMLFLDIETVGFHGMGLFLIGLMTYGKGGFTVRQLFARDYAEEAAVLEYLRSFYDDAGAVVTFNGRSFDLPFITDRAVVHKVELVRPEVDVDLLHAARRIWRGALPNCRLGTLERFVCGRKRAGDVPSHLIPQVYHEYVESRDAHLIVDVLRHNAYDLVTMAHLLAKMANG